MSNSPTHTFTTAILFAISETRDPIDIPIPIPIPTPTLTTSTVLVRGSERREFGKDVRRLIKMVREAVLNPCELNVAAMTTATIG